MCQVEGRLDESSKSKKHKYDIYIPRVTQLMKFHKSTVPRFQTKRPDTSRTNREPHVSHELTKPLTPKLIESAAEKEEKETKEVERYILWHYHVQSIHCLMYGVYLV